MERKAVWGHLLTLITMLIWGTTFASTKILLRDFSPVAILFYRFLIAFVLLSVLFPRTARARRNLKEELLFGALGLTGITLYFLTENIALQYTLAANVGLLIAAAPILTAVVAHCFTPDEKLSANLLLGFGIAISGVALVIFNGKIVMKLNPAGDILALAAALLWAVYSVLLKKVSRDHHPIFVVKRTFFYGLLTIVPCLFIFKTDLRPGHAVAAPLLFNILFLGVFASALCFVMWNQAVKWIGVVKAGNYIYLVPLITMVTSLLVIHEKVNGLMVWGGFLILGGVYISEKGLRSLTPFIRKNSLKEI